MDCAKTSGGLPWETHSGTSKGSLSYFVQLHTDLQFSVERVFVCLFVFYEITGSWLDLAPEL